jgi:hypothetical protein
MDAAPESNAPARRDGPGRFAAGELPALRRAVLQHEHGRRTRALAVQRVAFPADHEEKLDRYNRLLVNAGRYSAADGRLTIHPTFALVPEFVGGLGEFEYELAGDTLRLIWRVIRSADGVSDRRTAEGWSYHYTWVRMP